jgi:hypothetical protein
VSRKLLALFGLLVVAGALWYVLTPPGVTPPYDAYLNRLAQTEREGFCSGWAWWTAASSAEATPMAEDCRAGLRPRVSVRTPMDPPKRNGFIYHVSTRPLHLSSEVDMDSVVEAFCNGILSAGWGGGSGADIDTNRLMCVGLFQTNRLWPLYDPGVTNQWSGRFPYPGSDDEETLVGGLDDGP